MKEARQTNSTAAPNTGNVCHCSFENERGHAHRTVNVVVAMCMCLCVNSSPHLQINTPLLHSYPISEYRTSKTATRHCGGNSANKIWLFGLIVCNFEFLWGAFCTHPIPYKLPRIIVANIGECLFICLCSPTNGERESATQPHKYRKCVCMVFFVVHCGFVNIMNTMRRASHRLTRGLLFVSISAARMHSNGFFRWKMMVFRRWNDGRCSHTPQDRNCHRDIDALRCIAFVTTLHTIRTLDLFCYI